MSSVPKHVHLAEYDRRREGVALPAQPSIATGADMNDENTGEEIRCCYCEATEGECEHLLAVVDITFDACVGGYAYDRYRCFRDLIEHSFEDALELRAHRPVKWYDSDLDALWAAVIASFSVEHPVVDLDSAYVNRLVGRLFVEAGGKRYVGTESGGPGLSSSVAVYFTRNPKQVFEKSLALLRERLTATPKQR
jgi:hypothetical protein